MLCLFQFLSDILQAKHKIQILATKDIEKGKNPTNISNMQYIKLKGLSLNTTGEQVFTTFMWITPNPITGSMANNALNIQTITINTTTDLTET